MGLNNWCQVIIPPEALSFKLECVYRGMWVTSARNDVSEGIRAVASMMANKKLRINRQCKRVIQGISVFSWDPSKAKRGIEEPLKQNDDEAGMLRYGVFSKVFKWRYQ
jgi:hypothetical protein